MPIDDDDAFKSGEEECPGPADLESALLLETLEQRRDPAAVRG